VLTDAVDVLNVPRAAERTVAIVRSELKLARGRAIALTGEDRKIRLPRRLITRL